MLFGRPPALFAAAFAALVNVVVGLHLFGVELTADNVAQLNVAFLAIIALIAGTPLTDHEALAGAAAARKARKG